MTPLACMHVTSLACMYMTTWTPQAKLTPQKIVLRIPMRVQHRLQAMYATALAMSSQYMTTLTPQVLNT